MQVEKRIKLSKADLIDLVKEKIIQEYPNAEIKEVYFSYSKLNKNYMDISCNAVIADKS